MSSDALPVYFVSHGGGPWPWMLTQTDGMYDQLAASLRAMPAQIGQVPKAVLMVSAHWEESQFTVMSNPHPPMIYDYSGFPAHTYQIQYPAPGEPALAQHVAELIGSAGLQSRLDAQRGYDHGMYSPLVVVYPKADVPVVQLSLKAGLDPLEHLALGRALAPLRREGVLIVGSGLSYHNLRALGPAGRAPSAAFDAWLQGALIGTDATRRADALAHWRAAPGAHQSHPREEHLLPLMVAAGAAGDDVATRVYHQNDFFGSVTVSSFMFKPA